MMHALLLMLLVAGVIVGPVVVLVVVDHATRRSPDYGFDWNEDG